MRTLTLDLALPRRTSDVRRGGEKGAEAHIPEIDAWRADERRCEAAVKHALESLDNRAIGLRARPAAREQRSQLA